MLKYNIIIYINDGSKITLSVQYEKEYDLKRDITNLGVNGVLQKNEEIFEYFPPHRINKIEAVTNFQ